MTAIQKWDEPRPVKLTITDFLCLDDAGAFHAYAKVELIGGKVVAMNAQYSLHADVKGQIFRRLADACEAVHYRIAFGRRCPSRSRPTTCLSPTS